MDQLTRKWNRRSSFLRLDRLGSILDRTTFDHHRKHPTQRRSLSLKPVHALPSVGLARRESSHLGLITPFQLLLFLRHASRPCSPPDAPRRRRLLFYLFRLLFHRFFLFPSCLLFHLSSSAPLRPLPRLSAIRRRRRRVVRTPRVLDNALARHSPPGYASQEGPQDRRPTGSKRQA